MLTNFLKQAGCHITFLLALLSSNAASSAETSIWDDFKSTQTQVRSGERSTGAVTPQFLVQLDEDEWFQTDRDYTFGFRLTRRYNDGACYRSKKSTLTIDLLPDLEVTNGLDGERCAGSNMFDRHFEIFLGQQMYTPSRIDLPSARLRPSERPYAGWLYLGFTREIVASNDSYWRYGLSVGCTGQCSRGEQAQVWWHDIVGARRPQGWDSQIRTEIGANLNYEYFPLVFSAPAANFDASFGFKGNLGNITTDAGISGTVRFGMLNPRYGQFRATRNADSAVVSVRQPRSVFLFARADAKYVTYNALLEGSMFGNSSPRVVSPERFIHEYELGASITYRDWAISLSAIQRNNEVRDQPQAFREQRFGRVLVSLPF